MPMVYINVWAVLVSGVASFTFGYLWYGPLFGKQYMHLQGMTQEQAQEHMKNPALRRKMMWNYFFTFVLALVTAFVLAHAIYYASVYENMRGVSIGLLVGIMAWLGFVVPATINLVFFDKKNWSWWFLVNGYYLIQLALMGAILAAWM